MAQPWIEKDLISAVKRLRAKLGDSQQAFANRLGLSIRAIANYESNRRPTGKALAALAKVADAVGETDLANSFLSALGAELGAAYAPPWIREFPITVKDSREYIFMRIAQEMVANPKYFGLWKPFLDLTSPIYADLEAQGKLKADQFHQLIEQLEPKKGGKRK